MNYILKFSIFITILFNSSISIYALESDWSIDNVSKVRLISPLSHNDNQKEIQIGLEYVLESGWKTYWKSPGDGGFPQELTWSKSSNIESILLEWPSPKEFKILGLNSVGYEDKVLFPLTVNLINPNKASVINLSINYLVCKDICIPGKANLFLKIPAGQAKTTKHYHKIEKSISSLPQKNINLTNFSDFNIYINKDNELININLEATTQSNYNNPKIYLDTPFGLPFINPILNYSLDYKTLTASFYFDRKLFNKKNFDISALIIDKNHNYLFESYSKVKENNNFFVNNKLIYFFIVALIGGLILNVMPCVFPILSIKLLSVLETKKNETRTSFMLTSLGIVSSFLLLAFIFFIMRKLNINIFWGMQFQQPYFLILITFILSAFMLNLYGLFDFTTPRFINSSFFNLNFNNSYVKNYFNGFFATIMATPCSAPFVGTAVTAAFTQSNLTMFSIFLAMGIGMSAPYLIICLFPSLISFLPKPGKWMQIIKYILATFLLLTIIWIGNILLNHFNYLFIIVSILLLIISIYLIRKFSKKLLISFIILGIFFSLPSFHIFKQNILLNKQEEWKDFFEINIFEIIENEKVVFLDITADWCATCQYNKINVLDQNKIIEEFDKNNIIKVRADWTIPNKEIDNFLNKHRRYGIPFNAFFSKNYPQGIILSELLSEKELLKVLNIVTK